MLIIARITPVLRAISVSRASRALRALIAHSMRAYCACRPARSGNRTGCHRRRWQPSIAHNLHLLRAISASRASRSLCAHCALIARNRVSRALRAHCAQSAAYRALIAGLSRAISEPPVARRQQALSLSHTHTHRAHVHTRTLAPVQARPLRAVIRRMAGPPSHPQPLLRGRAWPCVAAAH